MRVAELGYLDVIDTQVELYENLNRRLEELSNWQTKYPQYRNEASALHGAGVELGEAIPDIDWQGNKLRLIHANVLFRDFIRRYEALWQTIQTSQPLQTP